MTLAYLVPKTTAGYPSDSQSTAMYAGRFCARAYYVENGGVGDLPEAGILAADGTTRTLTVAWAMGWDSWAVPAGHDPYPAVV